MRSSTSILRAAGDGVGAAPARGGGRRAAGGDGRSGVAGVGRAGAAGAPVLHPPLQLLLVEHALLHLLLLHLLRVELLRVGHRAHPLLGEPLGVVLVGADVGALLAELVGLRALLLEERLLLGDARRHLRLVLLQPLARALALLLGVLALELLATVALLDCGSSAG